MIKQIVSYNKQETDKLTGSIVDLRAMSDLRCWPAGWLNVVAPLVVDASVTVFYAICARSPDLSRTHPGDERRELPPQAEQTSQRNAVFGLTSKSSVKPIRTDTYAER